VGADRVSVPDGTSDEQRPGAALESVRRAHPEAVFAAIGPDGFRVAMPASLGLAPHEIIPEPASRATMIDLVVPGDMMAVVTIWERALRSGAAAGTVHTRAEPERPMTLVFTDARERHGVWLGMLRDPDGAGQRPDEGRSGPLLVSRRPRTASMTKSWNGVITGIDERATRMLGWSAGDLVGVRSLEFLHPEDHERALGAWLEMLSKLESQRVRVRHKCRDGAWLWVETENFVQSHGSDPQDAVVLTQISDISDEMAAYEALGRSERLFRRLAESLPFGLLQVASGGSLVYHNSRAATMLDVAGTTDLRDYLSAVVEQYRPALHAAFALTLEQGIDRELEVEIRQPGTGQPRRFAVSLIALTDQEAEPGALACLMDITESARLREVLRVKATFDTLTGCHNRASTLTFLNDLLTREERGVTGVIFIDLDRFKPVNDEYGHAAGDELLVHTAQQLTGLLRASDIVGRLGGDEFLLVCPELDGPEQALAIADRVSEVLHRPVQLAGATLTVGASIGVALAGPGTTGDALIASADAAMYESKRRGGGQPVLHTP
jgi:diguanylate cyclase (GGDEF)-like protein/PAS domain S-box-containing protein